MFRLLMIDEDFKIVEITLTVEAPWSRENLFDIRVTSLLLRHLYDEGIVVEKRDCIQSVNSDRSRRLVG